MSKIGRKHKGSPATRGKLLGNRHISERPAVVARRRQIGHFEGDTVMGADGRHCILTLVERATGYVVIKKLIARTMEQASAALARNWEGGEDDHAGQRDRVPRLQERGAPTGG